MENTINGNLDEAAKKKILYDIQLTNEAILAIIIFIPAVVLLLRSGYLNKRILINQLNNINIEASPTPVELTIIANVIVLIALIILGDVSLKRFYEQSQQNLKPEELKPFRIIAVVAIIRIIASVFAINANVELSNISEKKGNSTVISKNS